MATATLPASAKAIVTQFLNQYGLGSLTNWAWGLYAQAGGGQTGMDAITAELPNTTQFQTRFPAYQALAKAGRAMSVQQMLDYETQARQTFQQAGLPTDFYTKPDELAKFMEGDVSVAELQQRVNQASQAMISAPQDVRDQLHSMFGVDPGHLTAFFLDPDAALPILQQKYTAAQIGAEAARNNQSLTATAATGLAQLGVTDAQAAQGFQQLGTEQGLFEAQTTGERQIGQAEQLAGTFGGEGASVAQLAFAQRKAQREADFAGDVGFKATQTGVGGLAPTKRA